MQLHERSQRYGWELVYLSHEAVESKCLQLANLRERQAFAMINPKYRNVQVDFCKLILMRDHGGLWLDLRGEVVEEAGSVQGLEGVITAMGPSIPEVAFYYGGGHKEVLSSGDYGEVYAGVYLSEKGHPIWQRVIDATVDAIFEQEDICAQHGGIDSSRSRYNGTFSMIHHDKDGHSILWSTEREMEEVQALPGSYV